MKVAYIVSMFPCWSETFILDEILSLQRKGIEVFIYSLKPFSESFMHERAKQLLPMTIYGFDISIARVIILHLKLAAHNLFAYLKALKNLFILINPSALFKCWIIFFYSPVYVENIRQNNVQHLHAHFATFPGFAGLILSEFTGRQFSVTVHAHDIFKNQKIARHILKSANRIFAISKYNKSFVEDILKIKGEKIDIVHCGIDCRHFKFKEDRPLIGKDRVIRIVSIGRLCRIKGFNYLIDAVRLLRDEYFKIECTIIGDGPEKSFLMSKIYDNGLKNIIKLSGALNSDQLTCMMHNNDIFVLCCADDAIEGQDGIPMVLMEAMAIGLPVVATRISGVPELIDDGISGFLAEAHNAKSVKKKIEQVIESQRSIKQINRNARSKIENEFDIEKSTGIIKYIFEKLIDETHAPVNPN
jgi:colanic acid/amylovoran biosynthesis glycosyltransferase